MKINIWAASGGRFGIDIEGNIKEPKALYSVLVEIVIVLSNKDETLPSYISDVEEQIEKLLE